jgi:uncharacterized protein YggE
MRRRESLSLWPAMACFLFAAAALCDPVVAAEAPRGKITVNGTGTTEVKPDVAEIHTSVTANATLAADTVRKFRDNRRRAFELLHKLEIKDLHVEGKGPIITSVAANNNQQVGQVFFNFNVAGGQANQQASGLNCIESLIIRVPRIDRMKDEDAINTVVRVLDVCKDAGMTVASVQFKSTQMEANKATAIRAAVDAARRKAELLANLSHARVGPVISIQETSVVPGGFENLAQAASDSDVETVAANGLNIQVTGSTPLSLITVRAVVNVEFSLDKGN